MKLIKSQNKLAIVNAKYIHRIDIEDGVDEKGKTTNHMDIDIYFDSHENSWMQTIATYRTTEESIHNLNKLADFLSSSNDSGLYEMP